MPRYFQTVSESFNAPMQPVTPCRNFGTRACVDIVDNKTKYRKNECLSHHCTRFKDHYEVGSIPHEFVLNDNREPHVVESDYHDYLYCVRCKDFFCDLCDPSIFTEPCSNQDEKLF